MFLLINIKGVRRTYSKYLWHKEFDLGMLAKILGIGIYKVYGHTIRRKSRVRIYQCKRNSMKMEQIME